MQLNGRAVLAKTVMVAAQIAVEISGKQMAGRTGQLVHRINLRRSLPAAKLARLAAKRYAADIVPALAVAQPPGQFQKGRLVFPDHDKIHVGMFGQHFARKGRDMRSGEDDARPRPRRQVLGDLADPVDRGRGRFKQNHIRLHLHALLDEFGGGKVERNAVDHLDVEPVAFEQAGGVAEEEGEHGKARVTLFFFAQGPGKAAAGSEEISFALLIEGEPQRGISNQNGHHKQLSFVFSTRPARSK